MALPNDRTAWATPTRFCSRTDCRFCELRVGLTSEKAKWAPQPRTAACLQKECVSHRGSRQMGNEINPSIARNFGPTT